MKQLRESFILTIKMVRLPNLTPDGNNNQSINWEKESKSTNILTGKQKCRNRKWQNQNKGEKFKREKRVDTNDD